MIIQLAAKSRKESQGNNNELIGQVGVVVNIPGPLVSFKPSAPTTILK